MIHGIGVDLVTISRVAKVHVRFGERFERRILHNAERQQIRSHRAPTRFLAKRFAVKEAAVKALGTGERNGVLLRDFHVHHDVHGKPILHVDGEAARVAHALGIKQFHLSLSDEGDQVAAFVIAERN